MKQLIALTLIAFAPLTAFAHSGSNSLSCKSAAGAKQKIEISLGRSNTDETFGAHYTISLNGQKHEFKDEEELSNLGETIHNSPLGVIMVTANNNRQQNAEKFGSFTVTAIPSTVKAYNAQGKLQRWSMELEKDDCNDANGRARFKGVFKGYLNEKVNGEYSPIILEPQVMDCELKYNSGMAC